MAINTSFLCCKLYKAEYAIRLRALDTPPYTPTHTPDTPTYTLPSYTPPYTRSHYTLLP